MINPKKMLDGESPVNWKTVLVGWDGPGRYPRQLSVSDVAGFAARQIEMNPDQPLCVLQLAGAQDDELEMVDSCIRKLAAQENADTGIESRKWRLFLLKNALEDLGDDPLYGLIKLTEFWDKFDYPPDSPHIIQGVNNHISPQDYYSEDNYRRILERHKDWITKEESLLKVLVK